MQDISPALLSAVCQFSHFCVNNLKETSLRNLPTEISFYDLFLISYSLRFGLLIYYFYESVKFCCSLGVVDSTPKWDCSTFTSFSQDRFTVFEIASKSVKFYIFDALTHFISLARMQPLVGLSYAINQSDLIDWREFFL